MSVPKAVSSEYIRRAETLTVIPQNVVRSHRHSVTINWLLADIFEQTPNIKQDIADIMDFFRNSQTLQKLVIFVPEAGERIWVHVMIDALWGLIKYRIGRTKIAVKVNCPANDPYGNGVVKWFRFKRNLALRYPDKTIHEIMLTFPRDKAEADAIIDETEERENQPQAKLENDLEQLQYLGLNPADAVSIADTSVELEDA